MISLCDRIEIQTTPNQVFAWLERLPQEYRAWHPDHVACLVIQGSMLEVGSVIECKEYLHGKLHSLRFRMTRVVPGKRVEFVIEKMGKGAFEVQAKDNLVIFVAELAIGSEYPVIGSAFDLMFSIIFQKRLDAMRQHMKEEGENLKAILET